MEERTYNLKEASEILGRDKRSVIPFLKDGTLKGEKTGREWKITEQALKEFVKATNKERTKENRSKVRGARKNESK